MIAGHGTIVSRTNGTLVIRLCRWFVDLPFDQIQLFVRLVQFSGDGSELLSHLFLDRQQIVTNV